MPAGTDILHKLGILSLLRTQGAQAFSGIRFHLPHDRCLELNFGEISPVARGWVVPRMVLDEDLARFAGQQPGLQLREGFRVLSAHTGRKQVEVTGLYQGRLQTHRARLLIGADGIRSRFHNGFGIYRCKRRARRFALRTSYDQLQDNGGLVEVHCCKAGEAYVAPLDKGAARITLLLFGSAQRKRGAALSDLYFEKLSLFPRLLQRLKSPYPTGPVQSTGAISLEVSRCHGQRLLLVGDAAGAVDPVTGQGMTVALKDARLACQVLSERLAEDTLSEPDLCEYTRARKSYFRPSFQLAQMLLCAVRYPFLGRQTVRVLSRSPILRQKILRMAVL